MTTAQLQKSRSELKTLRKLVETACPSITELTRLKSGLEPQDIFFREKTVLLDSAIYTQKKSQ